jgi:hypothetical protein
MNRLPPDPGRRLSLVRGAEPGPHVPPAAELLRCADMAMRSAAPCWTVVFWVDGRGYRARFEYPGRLSVYVKATGELLARSKPGRPTAPESFRSAARGSR